MRFAGKTVVVTGAGGFIGSHVVERLVAEGATVRAMLRYTSRGQRGALDLLPNATLDSVAVTLGDVRDPDAVREVMRGADAVLHLAALIGIPYSYEHPQEVIDTNILGTSNVRTAEWSLVKPVFDRSDALATTLQTRSSSYPLSTRRHRVSGAFLQAPLLAYESVHSVTLPTKKRIVLPPLVSFAEAPLPSMEELASPMSTSPRTGAFPFIMASPQRSVGDGSRSITRVAALHLPRA